MSRRPHARRVLGDQKPGSPISGAATRNARPDTARRCRRPARRPWCRRRPASRGAPRRRSRTRRRRPPRRRARPGRPRDPPRHVRRRRSPPGCPRSPPTARLPRRAAPARPPTAPAAVRRAACLRISAPPNAVNARYGHSSSSGVISRPPRRPASRDPLPHSRCRGAPRRAGRVDRTPRRARTARPPRRGRRRPTSAASSGHGGSATRDRYAQARCTRCRRHRAAPA